MPPQDPGWRLKELASSAIRGTLAPKTGSKNDNPATSTLAQHSELRLSQSARAACAGEGRWGGVGCPQKDPLMSTMLGPLPSQQATCSIRTKENKPSLDATAHSGAAHTSSVPPCLGLRPEPKGLLLVVGPAFLFRRETRRFKLQRFPLGCSGICPPTTRPCEECLQVALSQSGCIKSYTNHDSSSVRRAVASKFTQQSI